MVASMFANIANPTIIDAMFVSSTGRRADVRRFTIGSVTRSWYGIQIASTTAARAKQPSVRVLPQPHAPPLRSEKQR